MHALEKGDTAALANGTRLRNVTRKAGKEVVLWCASRCALTRGTRTVGLCVHMLVVVQLQGRWRPLALQASWQVTRYREIIGNIRMTLTLANWYLKMKCMGSTISSNIAELLMRSDLSPSWVYKSGTVSCTMELEPNPSFKPPIDLSNTPSYRDVRTYIRKMHPGVYAPSEPGRR